MARQARTFTIFDVLDRKGYFDSNPANAQSTSNEGEPLYTGPLKYPMMFYHPEGEEHILVPGTYEQTQNGVQFLGEKKEIIWQLVESEEKEIELRGLGWHDHPAKAMAAAQELDPKAFGGKAPPPMAAAGQISKLEEKIAQLQKELDKSKAKPVVTPVVSTKQLSL